MQFLVEPLGTSTGGISICVRVCQLLWPRSGFQLVTVLARRRRLDLAQELSHGVPELVAPFDSVVTRARQGHGALRPTPRARKRSAVFHRSDVVALRQDKQRRQ